VAAITLAIPIFVRSRDEKGKDFLEFATAMNVSAGGALVAVRRSLPHSTQVSLEIPTAPFLTAKGQPQGSRNMRARAVRVEHADGYQLVGLRLLDRYQNNSLPGQSFVGRPLPNVKSFSYKKCQFVARSMHH